MKEAERKEQLNLSIESVKILDDIDTMIFETSDLMKKYPDNKELKNIKEKAIEHREFLIKATEKENAKYTHEFASRVADEVLKKALEEKIDVILDGTLKNYETPLERVKIFKEKGYAVEINTVVVKREKSYLSNLMRYEELLERKKIPRLAPKEVHDKCLVGYPETISKLYETGLVDEIKLYNRNKECVYDMSKTPNINPKQIITNEFEREWNREEYIDYLKEWDKLKEKYSVNGFKDNNREEIEDEKEMDI